MTIEITVTEQTSTTYNISPEKIAQHPVLQRFIEDIEASEERYEISEVLELLDTHAETGQYDVHERDIAIENTDTSTV